MTPEHVRQILDDLPDGRPPAVAVTVNETSESIRRILDTTAVDIIQLSGDESPALLRDIDTTFWKALRFTTGTTLDDARRAIEPWVEGPHRVSAILLDAAVDGSYGGSGHTADWTLSARLAEQYPVILAGGLSPENVGDAIQQVDPMGVDVSSGVESGGSKDHGKIRDFVSAALTSFETLTVQSSSR